MAKDARLAERQALPLASIPASSRLPRRRLLLGAGCLAVSACASGDDNRRPKHLPGWSEAAYQAARAALPALARWPDAASFSAAHRVEPVSADPVKITAYFEPVLEARRRASPAFPVPLLTPPAGWTGPLPDRAAITRGALTSYSAPLFWLADPVDLFFLQIQGSGRLQLEDGTMVRIGYAGRNGHDYVSIGRLMRREGLVPVEDAHADGIAAWLRADAERGRAMMNRNPAYIFFTERRDLDPTEGPQGAWGQPLPRGHAVAVDPSAHPYGSLLWIETSMPPKGYPAAALWMAMDTGSAIKGPGRFDLFLGSGPEAGAAAGVVNTAGRVHRILPAATA